MLIRRPADEVYQAFTEPGVTSWFWFTHADRRMSPGAHLTWTWGMYGVATRVLVKALEPNRRILIDWNLDDDPTEVEWMFEERGPATWVEVSTPRFPRPRRGGKGRARSDGRLHPGAGGRQDLAGARHRADLYPGPVP